MKIIDKMKYMMILTDEDSDVWILRMMHWMRIWNVPRKADARWFVAEPVYFSSNHWNT